MALADALSAAGGIAMLLGTGTLTAAVLRIRGTAAFLAASLVTMAATVVAISLALSLFSAYNRAALLLVQLAALILISSVWILNGRPRPLVYRPSLHELREAAKGHRLVAAILLALVAAFAVEAVLAVGVAPNNYDSMYYHLSRIGYWMQNDSVFQFEGGSIYQLQHPPNAEILQAWTMDLSHGDRLAQLVQWLALGGLVCVIYAGARFLRFSIAHSLFAAAVFATLPLPVLEASTTQNDLVAAFFVCAAALFLARAIAGSSAGDAMVGAAAIGIAIGTKGTVLLALPGLALLITAALWRWRPPTRFVVSASTLVVVAVLLLGSVNYVETTLNSGTPFGEISAVKTRSEAITQSALRTLWGFVDVPASTAVPSWAGEPLERAASAVWGDEAASSPRDVAVHEDLTGFGPIGLFVLLPLLGFILIRRRESSDRRFLAAAALSYIALFLLTLRAEPYDMRLMIIPVALGAPLLARAAKNPWVRGLTVLGAVAFLVPCLFYNEQKPLRPGNVALAKDRAGQRAGSHNGLGPMLRNLDEALANSERVGFMGGDVKTAWDYPLFGPHFDRYVVRLKRRDVDTQAEVRAALRANELDAIVWGVRGRPDAPPVTRLGSSTFEYWVYTPSRRSD